MLTPNDCILYWNDVALEANRVSHTNDKKEQAGPPLSARALAIVHIGMYEAYAAIKGLPTFYKAVTLPAPPANSSARAAVAAAAHALLSRLYPGQKAIFDRRHETAPVDAGNVPLGHAFGLTVATAIWETRKLDPGVSDEGYAPSIARYAHRVDPDNPKQGYHAPFYGSLSSPFAVVGNPMLDKIDFTSLMYKNALVEVRGLGISPSLTGTLPASFPRRTTDQTLAGIYWGYDGSKGLGTPPRLYNQIIRKVAEKQENDEVANATLFTLINIAMGDAGIIAWREKYRHDIWRPVVGIREENNSIGWTPTPESKIDEACDPFWLPLGAPATNSGNQEFEMAKTSTAFPFNQITTGKAKNFSPGFPAYPSGHATFGAAAFYITRMFYGKHTSDTSPDNLFDGLGFASEELNGRNQDNNGTVRPRHERSFPGGLMDMIVENGRGRVYLGVHWVFDAFAVKPDGEIDLTQNVGGVRLGLDIAKDIYQRLRPSNTSKTTQAPTKYLKTKNARK